MIVEHTVLELLGGGIDSYFVFPHELYGGRAGPIHLHGWGCTSREPRALDKAKKDTGALDSQL
jgi:hypothetical protein